MDPNTVLLTLIVELQADKKAAQQQAQNLQGHLQAAQARITELEKQAVPPGEGAAPAS